MPVLSTRSVFWKVRSGRSAQPTFFKHGWSEAFQNLFLDVRKIEDLVPELVGVDHGHRTKRLKASSHGTLAGPNAANHAQHGDDFSLWLGKQRMKDSKRRMELGRISFGGLEESGNEEVCEEALPGRPNQKGLEECGNIVPSHAAGVNNQDVFILRPPFSASSGRTKTGWQKNGGQKNEGGRISS